MNINDQVNREIGIHGQKWNEMHEGYFSSPLVAHPLVETITKYLLGLPADVLVDLGGGTGFILLELIAKGITTNIIPINLDCSETQLEAMEKSGIFCVNRSISDFKRHDLSPLDKSIFFIMRSVLHYFGKDGLIPILRHIRNQARQKEIFIHQTACFKNAEEARCINFLYKEMHTQKWYPTIAELHDSMTTTDWQIMETFPALPLKLTSAELGLRYGLDLQSLENICSRVNARFGEIENVFQLTSNGFVAHLCYNICVSKAV
ncbi:MAG TPA: hypothetical protein DCX03_02365 [Bacteroidales bacterium]|nr:hypothetical protein [Bacteroidales bacterium]